MSCSCVAFATPVADLGSRTSSFAVGSCAVAGTRFSITVVPFFMSKYFVRFTSVGADSRAFLSSGSGKRNPHSDSKCRCDIVSSLMRSRQFLSSFTTLRSTGAALPIVCLIRDSRASGLGIPDPL